MDRYDEKQLQLFRKIIQRDITHCEKTVSEWKDKPGEDKRQCLHMVNTYEAKKRQCESLLEEFDELFRDYLDLEEPPVAEEVETIEAKAA